MEGNFSLEPIKELRNYQTIAYEMLFKSNIPNKVLFSKSNPYLEHYVLHQIINIINEKKYNENKLYNVNISAPTIISYFDHIERLPENFFYDVNSNGNLSNEDIIKKLKQIRHRVFLDGYGIGNGNLETVKKIEPKGVKFDRVMLSTNDEIISQHLKQVSGYTELVVFKMLSNITELERVKSIGFNFAQGYVFPQ